MGAEGIDRRGQEETGLGRLGPACASTGRGAGSPHVVGAPWLTAAANELSCGLAAGESPKLPIDQASGTRPRSWMSVTLLQGRKAADETCREAC